MDYIEPGSRVHVEFDGVVTEPEHQSYRVYYKDGLTTSRHWLEVRADNGIKHMIYDDRSVHDVGSIQVIEPEYIIGQAYISVDGQVYVYSGDGWLMPGKIHVCHEPKRPLRKLVPESEGE